MDPEDTSLPPPITSLRCVTQCLKSSTHNSLSAGMEVNLCMLVCSMLGGWGWMGEWEAKVSSTNSEGVPNSGYHLRTCLQHGS